MEGEKEYISVADVSNITGKTIQSIYKRIRNSEDKIQEFVKKDNAGNFIIDTEALKVIYNIDKENDNTKLNYKRVSESSVKFSNKKEEKQQENQVISELREQISLLKQQIETQKEAETIKDKLIFELNERLKENQVIIEQQQKLALTDKQHIAFLEEQYNKRKKPFLLRLFSGKNQDEWKEEN